MTGQTHESIFLKTLIPANRVAELLDMPENTVRTNWRRNKTGFVMPLVKKSGSRIRLAHMGDVLEFKRKGKAQPPCKDCIDNLALLSGPEVGELVQAAYEENPINKFKLATSCSTRNTNWSNLLDRKIKHYGLPQPVIDMNYRFAPALQHLRETNKYRSHKIRLWKQSRVEAWIDPGYQPLSYEGIDFEDSGENKVAVYQNLTLDPILMRPVFEVVANLLGNYPGPLEELLASPSFSMDAIMADLEGWKDKTKNLPKQEFYNVNTTPLDLRFRQKYRIQNFELRERVHCHPTEADPNPESQLAKGDRVSNVIEGDLIENDHKIVGIGYTCIIEYIDFTGSNAGSSNT